ncbi:glycosyltransferase [Sphingobacterium paludis]|uniref:Cellulose synthase/poly-beta-1,6-N-acetylglucosamine synthase-like glycosyltransferase n=1 Tax=Sphingobacterium paludis TaxID=1476465 RepID=A0A4V3E1D4_9SPHI|nr:glycosyltransferase [Sphingobacterium paludis]TDS12248.1 cellulose synthase/poly-beta-1,6-N-acetylglucosamine synthase-like glycosyltransferase [Sphingobacterium paludis]
MFFSIIIPLFNRPQEIDELLQSLTMQRYRQFEVIIVEDGSTKPAKDIVEKYVDVLDVRYFEKPNEGQGFARNFGFARAKGDYFIVFDSDILVPHDYFDQVIKGLRRDGWDAFGGPDAAHASFTPIQKAISYSMTSPFTTGGIRGNKARVGAFHPRSFNMGLSRAVYDLTKGFKLPRRSEDIEFSIRMIDMGFRVGLIPEAFVYHKRRATFLQFFKQTNFFGKGRIDIYQMFPQELKPVHALPAVFVLGLACLLVLNVVGILFHTTSVVVLILMLFGNSLLSIYTFLLFLHACLTTKSVWIGVLSVLAAYTQLIAYGSGFLGSYIEKVWLKK